MEHVHLSYYKTEKGIIFWLDNFSLKIHIPGSKWHAAIKIYHTKDPVINLCKNTDILNRKSTIPFLSHCNQWQNTQEFKLIFPYETFPPNALFIHCFCEIPVTCPQSICRSKPCSLDIGMDILKYTNLFIIYYNLHGLATGTPTVGTRTGQTKTTI